MTEQTKQDVIIIADDAGQATHAVPCAVLDAHQATPDQRAEYDATIGDAVGFCLPAEAPLHVLTVEELEPYRLSDAQLEALAAQQAMATDTDDVRGHEQYIGQFPRTVSVRPADTFGAQFSAFGRPTLWVTPMQARDPYWNRDANFYPKLH